MKEYFEWKITIRKFIEMVSRQECIVCTRYISKLNIPLCDYHRKLYLEGVAEEEKK